MIVVSNAWVVVIVGSNTWVVVIVGSNAWVATAVQVIEDNQEGMRGMHVNIRGGHDAANGITVPRDTAKECPYCR